MKRYLGGPFCPSWPIIHGSDGRGSGKARPTRFGYGRPDHNGTRGVRRLLVDAAFRAFCPKRYRSQAAAIAFSGSRTVTVRKRPVTRNECAPVYVAPLNEAIRAEFAKPPALGP
jgi:hypothetical protein